MHAGLAVNLSLKFLWLQTCLAAACSTPFGALDIAVQTFGSQPMAIGKEALNFLFAGTNLAAAEVALGSTSRACGEIIQVGWSF
jgi:hypothetical protein